MKNSDLVRKCVEQMEAQGRVKDTRVRVEALTGSQMRPAKGESEAQFQKRVVAYARSRKWRKIAHFRKVRVQRKDGSTYWETPVAEDGTGFLDLELVRERIVKVELKVKPNKPTPEQVEWVEAYKAAGVEVYVWYPEDWDTIVEVLK